MNKFVLLVLGPVLFSGGLLYAQSDRGGNELFESRIRPVLVEQCYQCHSTDAQKNRKLKGGLRLDTREGLRKGGDTGPAIVPGKPAKSLLVKALRHEELRMPPKGKLSDVVIADFERWITLGAPDPRDENLSAQQAIDWEKARTWWAFQAPKKRPPSTVKNIAWPTSDIDNFVLAELEAKNLRPVRGATRPELIRRATFDLIGLPPTPAEIDQFVNDRAPHAFARVVDRLLASPHYGERWGRYWLDVARYADDKALAVSQPRQHSYRYRDWVIRAFNDDMPYDQFLMLQIAGDALSEPADQFVRLAGLGFQGLGAEYHRGNFAAQVMADELDDRIDTLARGVLGLTVACARCHDHKYDPISAGDYYSLAAAYQGSTLVEIPASPLEVVERYQAWQVQVKKQEAELNQWLKEQGKDPSRFNEDQKKLQADLKATLDELKKAAPPPPLMVHGIKGGGQAMRIHIRGKVDNLGAPAAPGFLTVLRKPGESASGSFTRLELARAVAAPDNPLTARVLVNRVWQHHFGRGLVATTSNFGALGERPTHPELLDTLAVRFTESGWSLKWLHRAIMLSSVYQLSSMKDQANARQDPENRNLWRMTPRRLDLEAWRDALLAVSGRMNARVCGPSFPLDSQEPRRTVYAKVSRAVPDAMAALFDFPDANATSERRLVTTVPQQQLFVLNSPLMIESARAFAVRLEKAEIDAEKRIVLAYRLAFGREPEADEARLAQEFLRTALSERLSAWEQFAQALLAANEFAWID